MTGDVTIRSATEQDLPRIADIQNAAPEASHWNPAAYLSYQCFVAEASAVDGCLVAGFIVVRENTPGEKEILNMAVDPAYRRQGIAHRLIQPLLIGDVFLEVRESNVAARSLYESSRFRAIGRRRAYYADPREDAIVMRFFS